MGRGFSNVQKYLKIFKNADFIYFIFSVFIKNIIILITFEASRYDLMKVLLE